jgi:hypothetical protein
MTANGSWDLTWRLKGSTVFTASGVDKHSVAGRRRG